MLSALVARVVRDMMGGKAVVVAAACADRTRSAVVRLRRVLVRVRVQDDHVVVVRMAQVAIITSLMLAHTRRTITALRPIGS